MSNNWSIKNKRWKEAHLSALKPLYLPQEMAATHRSLVPPSPSTKKPKKALESERKAQQRLVQWLFQESIPFYAVPNGANVPSHHRQTLLSEGLQPGVPDLCIPRARGRYHGLYIELKREDGGSGLSDVQKHWLNILQEEGYHAVKCDGFNKAKEKVEWYLSLNDYFDPSVDHANISLSNISQNTKKENIKKIIFPSLKSVEKK